MNNPESITELTDTSSCPDGHRQLTGPYGAFRVDLRSGRVERRCGPRWVAAGVLSTIAVESHVLYRQCCEEYLDKMTEVTATKTFERG